MNRARAVGLILGVGLDAVFGDPRRGHPVAAFGRAAAAVERRIYADSRGRGVVFAGVCAAGATGLGWVAESATEKRPVSRALATAAATWAVLGGTSLVREGRAMAAALEAADLGRARGRLSHLCARDPAGLGADELARATVESLAENTSDAAVAPLLWGAVAGIPGLLGYRAINTLDAMVGYKNPRYRNFGWAAARLDDLANWLPARATGLLTVAIGPDRKGAWRVLRRDGGRHPSPNAGRCEAAFAGALGVRLGGTNSYAGLVEERPELGDGRPPRPADIGRAARLSTVVTAAAAMLSCGILLVRGRGQAGQ